mmetsp:Transcript_41900/g.54012  ORF Transcript_41900/g.54012 Transcript_41900/m.54012 type:complete len:552 (-) Transcript_41900:142-1797(-)
MGGAVSVQEQYQLSSEDVQYLESKNALKPLANALKVAVDGKHEEPMQCVAQELQKELEQKNETFVHGCVVSCNKNTQLLVGPLVGEVTTMTANIVVEVVSKEDQACELICHVLRKEDKTKVLQVEKSCKSRRPSCFHLEGLEPNTEYISVFSGLSRGSALKCFAVFKTKDENPKQFKIIAVSCDRPSRLFHGQVNPWSIMHKQVGPVDCMLHLGDQVYAYASEEIDVFMDTFDKEYDQASPEMKQKMMQRGRELMRRKYRQVYGLPEQKKIYRHSSHLMIWSDNDVANDFTTKKKADGSQGYHPAFLQCAMEVYREYQRLLWDHECAGDLPQTEEPLEEWHSHIYGDIGIFLIDMRGNRINGKGVQLEAPLVCDKQWNDLEAMLKLENLKVLVVCSEIPFVTDSPEIVKANAVKVPFLVDHWCYNEADIAKLLELVFNWKNSQPGREVVLVGGDIHTGVTSIIRDAETGLEIPHLTTSPITNKVCNFFSAAEGKVNDRFSFEHAWLGNTSRNWAEINIDLDGKIEVDAKLVPVSTDEYAEMEWCSSDEEEG